MVETSYCWCCNRYRPGDRGGLCLVFNGDFYSALLYSLTLWLTAVCDFADYPSGHVNARSYLHHDDVEAFSLGLE